jgi:A/G-specific adenine glycosylase
MTRTIPSASTKLRSSLGLPLLSTDDWRRLRSWYKKNGRNFPWRHDVTPWSILLAETLLHRTGANVVSALYPLIRRRFPSPGTVTKNKNQWISALYAAGLSWRVRTFVYACEVLVRRYGATVPSDRSQLECLPGVGHYTASAVRCFGYGFREFITDTNTIRLAGRLAGESVNPAKHRSNRIQALTTRLSHNSRPLRAKDNYALLDLAAIVCRSRNPFCLQCPLLRSCRTGVKLTRRKRLSQP